MEPVRRFTSRMVALPIDNIDTDQIIPARFLKGTDRSGLEAGLFADWRYDAEGRPRVDFALNRADAQGARVLVAGQNFGCGSSREHAPWALLAFGFQAVVSTDFADIFRANALRNGLLPLALGHAVHDQLLETIARDPAAEITIDLEAQAITLPDGGVEPFPVDPFERHCLLHGVDRLGFLLEQETEIARFEAGHHTTASTVVRHV